MKTAVTHATLSYRFLLAPAIVAVPPERRTAVVAPLIRRISLQASQPGDACFNDTNAYRSAM
jgi:hypothetical protein